MLKKIEERKLIISQRKKIKYFNINKYKNNCSIQNGDKFKSNLKVIK